MREFRGKISAGHFLIGAAISLSDSAVTEALGRVVDFFWIDLEHSPLGLESLQTHLIAARAVGVPALVRVPASESWFIKRVIDAGAAGLIVPQVRSANEAQRVVEACRYRPEGDRGYGPRRASNYGYDVHYLDTINQDLFVAVQIEHIEAMRALDAIVAVPGLDSLVLGPYDLSVSMGLAGQVAHPDVIAAITRVIATAKERGLFIGMGGPAQEDYVLRAAEMGVQWIQCGCDFQYMIQFFGQFASRISDRIPGRTNAKGQAGLAAP
jgi:2-dehydro-3-deoxyglucarate aldolase/4-hydroxy-2-oxoheptanedioate aldolase